LIWAIRSGRKYAELLIESWKAWVTEGDSCAARISPSASQTCTGVRHTSYDTAAAMAPASAKTTRRLVRRDTC